MLYTDMAIQSINITSDSKTQEIKHDQKYQLHCYVIFGAAQSTKRWHVL